MKKVIHTDILKILNKCSVRISYIFIEGYLKTDHAGILDLNMHPEYRKHIPALKLFSKSILIKKDLVIYLDCIKWTYGYLKPNYNPHGKAWNCIRDYNVEYDKDKKQIV